MNRLLEHKIDPIFANVKILKDKWGEYQKQLEKRYPEATDFALVDDINDAISYIYEDGLELKKRINDIVNLCFF
jgi:hypothetical protein